MGRFRQRVKRGAAVMCVMRQIMCLLFVVEAVLEDTQTKSMNLKASIIHPLLFILSLFQLAER